MSKIQDQFSFQDYTYREFQAFLIILSHEGEELSVLKETLKNIFGHKSRTKAYDYINNLCKKGVIYKKSSDENGEKKTKIFVENEERRNYEKFILPTISDAETAAKELNRDKSRELNNLELVRKKFKNYTDFLFEEVKELIKNTSVEVIKKKRFLNTIENQLSTYFKAEMLKYEFFSK